MENSEQSEIRDRKVSRLELTMLSLLIIVFGIFLPIPTGSVAPPEGMVNPFWGTIFGLGYFTWYEVAGPPPLGIVGLLYGVFGFLLWPSFVVYGFVKLLKAVRRSLPILGVLLFYGLFFISLIYSVPVSAVQGSWVEHLPIFVKYLDFGPRAYPPV